MTNQTRGQPWPRPRRPPWYGDVSERVFKRGLPVLSLSAAIRGVTLGGGAPCPSKTCDGYLICVDWETGQLTHPCTKGWVAHSWPIPHLRIVRGGEITGRVINRRDPLPSDQWPARRDVSGVDWVLLGTGAPTALVFDQTPVWRRAVLADQGHNPLTQEL